MPLTGITPGSLFPSLFVSDKGGPAKAAALRLLLGLRESTGCRPEKATVGCGGCCSSSLSLLLTAVLRIAGWLAGLVTATAPG